MSGRSSTMATLSARWRCLQSTQERFLSNIDSNYARMIQFEAETTTSIGQTFSASFTAVHTLADLLASDFSDSSQALVFQDQVGYLQRLFSSTSKVAERVLDDVYKYQASVLEVSDPEVGKYLSDLADFNRDVSDAISTTEASVGKEEATRKDGERVMQSSEQRLRVLHLKRRELVNRAMRLGAFMIVDTREIDEELKIHKSSLSRSSDIVSAVSEGVESLRAQLRTLVVCKQAGATAQVEMLSKREQLVELRTKVDYGLRKMTECAINAENCLEKATSIQGLFQESAPWLGNRRDFAQIMRSIVHVGLDTPDANVKDISDVILRVLERQEDEHEPLTAEEDDEVRTLTWEMMGSYAGFDESMWYRLTNDSSRNSNTLDVVNDGAGNEPGHLKMVAPGNYSGQFWKFTRQPYNCYTLCTMYLGRGRPLEVRRNDRTRPYLATAGSVSGQQWKFEALANGAFRMANSTAGPHLHFGATNSSNELIMGRETGLNQRWFVTPIRCIEEEALSASDA